MPNRNRPTTRKRTKVAPNITLPAVVGYPAVFPVADFLCPWCRAHKIGEPHSFAELFGGALRRTGKDSYSQDSNLAGYLELGWHPQEGDKEFDANFCFSIRLAYRTHAGQFAFYFCSTACMRAFLNFCVDELESTVAKGRHKPKTKPIARRK